MDAEYTEIDQNLARRAFAGTSWDSETAGRSASEGWASDVNNVAKYLRGFAKTDEQKAKAELLISDYKIKSKELFEGYLEAHSKCISWVIAGRSGFNVKSAQRSGDRADKYQEEYYMYTQNAPSRYARIIQKTMTPEELEKYKNPNTVEFFKKLNDDIKLSIAISQKPKGSVPSYIKTNMMQSLRSRFETLWQNREYSAFNEGLELIIEKTKDSKAVLFAPNNAIWERSDSIDFADLPKSKEYDYLITHLDKLYDFETKPTEDFVAKLREIFNTCFNILRSQQRYMSFQIAADKLRQVQEDLGIKFFEIDNWIFADAKKFRRVLETAKQGSAKTSTIYEAEGLYIEDNVEDQRVRLFFDGKPSEEIRTYLKSNGFRWSPSTGSWQRQNTPAGIGLALEFAKKYFPKKQTPEPPKPEPPQTDTNSIRYRALLLKMRMAAAILE